MAAKKKKTLVSKESKGEKRFYVKRASRGPQFKLASDVKPKGYRDKKEYKIT